MKLRERISESPLAILTQHFLVRYFEIDEAQSGELRTGIPAILGLSVAPGIMLCGLLFEKYSTLVGWFRGVLTLDRDLTTLHDKYIFITMAFVVTGLVTLLKWTSLFPDRRDYMILAPLPIRAATIFFAKLLALSGFLLLFAVAVNLAGCLMFPSVVLGKTGTFGDLVRYSCSHMAAMLCASLGGVLLVVVTAGFWMNVLPTAMMRRFSSRVQFVLFTFFATQLLLAPEIAGTVILFERGEIWRSLLFPPLWFLGLYEQLLARSIADLSVWAGWAKTGLAFGALASIAFYVLGYVRHFRKTAENVDADVAPGRLPRFWPALKDAQEAAISDFVKQTVTRNGLHRLLLGIFIGLGAAVILRGLASRFLFVAAESGAIDPLTLAAPLVISFFLLAGLRFLLEVPVDRQAAWIFRLSIRDQDSERVLRGVRAVLFELGIVAWLAVVVPVNVVLLGMETGLAHSVFCILVSLLALDALLLGYRKIPFTAAFNSDRTNLGVALTLWSALFAAYVYGTTSIEAALLQKPIAFCLALVTLFAAWRLLIFLRDRWTPAAQPMDFSDGIPPVVLTLDLKLD